MGSFVVQPPIKGESLEDFFTIRGDGFAARLVNLIPNDTCISLRRGYKKYYSEATKASRIMSYAARNTLVIAEDGKLFSLKEDKKTEIKVSGDHLNHIINYIETNNRLIIFFSTRHPLILYLDSDNKWSTEDLSLKINNNEQNIVLSGAVKYKERLFLFNKGNNKVYYLESGTFKGEATEYILSDRFGSKGSLLFLSTLGFNAGANVVSFLYAVFDSGDILTFSGINPKDLNNWQIDQKVETGLKIQDFVSVFTDSLLVCDGGIFSLTEILKNNNISSADYLSKPIKKRIYEWMSSGSLRMCQYGGFLYIFNLGAATHIGINLATSACFELQGMEVDDFTILNGELIFKDKSGWLFEAFSNSSDDGKQIHGIWESNFLTLEDLQRFQITSCAFECYADGVFNLKIFEKINDRLFLLERTEVNIDDSSISWKDIQLKPWSFIEDLLWGSYGLKKYNIINTTFGSETDMFAFKVDVWGSYVNDFSFNRVVVNFN